ncbi:MAG: hypothetical protein AABX19_03545 [Nanoarchaeota archaeon]
MDKLKECFSNALKDENKGKKHKGLLKVEVNEEAARDYIKKAKKNLEVCEALKQMGIDYKIPEEWFYTLYYCALAILSKFGVESRSQKCTALFIRYLKDNKIIDYNEEFINRITVYSDKEEKSDVDKREDARYSPSIKIEEVKQNYNNMMNLCKKAISQAEEIIYSTKKYEIPKEIL